jgi:hypothetical protein
MITWPTSAETLPKWSLRLEVGVRYGMLFVCMNSIGCARKLYCTVQVFPSALVQEKPLVLVN